MSACFKRYAASLLLAMLAWSGACEAQILEDVEVAGAGGEAEVTVRFASTIRYQRHVAGAPGNVVQLFFAVTGGIDSSRGILEDQRSFPATDATPALTVRLLAPLGRVTGRRIDITFDQPVTLVRAGPGADNRTLVVVLRAATPAPTPAAAPAAAPLVTPADSAGAIGRARQSIEDQRNEDAVGLLNQMLNLPPNASTQEAQELIGYAREGLGEIDRARAEYQLYLKLYPDGPGAERVKARLEGLSKRRVAGGGSRSAAPAAPETLYWGSVATYYYGGNSRIRTENIVVTPATNATVIDTQTLNSTDQSALVASVDLNARYRSGNWDNRVVFRDIGLLSFLSDQSNENRMTALYGDVRYQPRQVSARLGRQTSTTGGVLGRFDGGAFSWGFAPSWRVGALAGTPSDPVLGERKTFAGVTLDADDLADGLGAGVFAIRQRTEGLDDREAVGGELRYFTPRLTVFALLDYDIQYDVLNIGSAQGTLQFENKAALNFLYDYRRSPTLQLSNALLGEPDRTLRDLLDSMSREDLEQQALGLTPVSRVLLLGGTYPITQRWQLGLEFRQSSLTGTSATSTLPAAAGTGDVHTYTLQAIGTGIVAPTGVLTLTASSLASDAFDALLLAANARFSFRDRWTLEPSLRWYQQDNSVGSNLERLSPTLRVTYQIRERLAFESEFTFEHSTLDSDLVDETDLLLFYYLGLRFEF